MGLMTNVSKVCTHVREKVSAVYRSQKVKACQEKVVKNLGVSSCLDLIEIKLTLGGNGTYIQMS